MQSRRVPRLGLLARLGFCGALGAGLLAAAAVYLHHRRTPSTAELSATPPVLVAAAASPAPAPASPSTGFDPIDRLLGIKARASGVATAADTTGSIVTADSKPNVGPVTKLPLPRFVSLKTDKVNVRQGPTRDQKVSFIFQRAGLPVEITAEFENWRRIRDSEGSEGWILQNLLSGRRTALVAPWSKEKALPLHGHADAASGVVALLQPGVLATIRSCADNWCRVRGEGFDGWIEQDRLWGAYPGESVD